MTSTQTEPKEPKTVFDDEVIREKLEKNLPPFNVEELLKDGRLSQTITVGKNIKITFTTLDSGTDMIIEKFLYKLTSEQGYSYNKTAMPLQLAASISSYNGSPLVKNPVDYDGSNEDKYMEYLEKAFKKITQFDRHFVVLLGTHLFWFDERVTEFMKNEFLEQVENF